MLTSAILRGPEHFSDKIPLNPVLSPLTAVNSYNFYDWMLLRNISLIWLKDASTHISRLIGYIYIYDISPNNHPLFQWFSNLQKGISWRQRTMAFPAKATAAAVAGLPDLKKRWDFQGKRRDLTGIPAVFAMDCSKILGFHVRRNRLGYSRKNTAEMAPAEVWHGTLNLLVEKITSKVQNPPFFLGFSHENTP